MADLPYPLDRGGTHSDRCYRWQHHQNCAVLRVDELEAEAERLRAELAAATEPQKEGK